MIQYTVYIKSTGQIVSTGICQKISDIDYLLTEDNLYVEESSKENQYIENGKIVDMPPKPIGEYQFDYATKQWIFDTEFATMKALSQRNILLADGPDRISPLWWAAMTSEQQTAWSQYRQDLLDITKQPDFPNVIIWPTKPTEGV